MTQLARLTTLAGRNFRWPEGVGDGTKATRWGRLDAAGFATTAHLLQLLATNPTHDATVGPPRGTGAWIWPGAAGGGTPTRSELQDLAGILTPDQLEAVQARHRYDGLRVVVTDDGIWLGFHDRPVE